MKPISLVVCTRDRSQALRRCLDAISRADFTDTGGELVLVNNASSDDTDQVMEEFARSARFPVTVVSEPQPGLSNARNAGLAAATGEIVAFTDDDCYIAEDFLSAAIKAFDDHDIDYFGGRILRYDKADAFYACNDKDSYEPIKAGAFIRAGMIQGANMGFTRRLLELVGRFDPDLGAGTQFRCEDVDYIARASAAGFTGAHVPEVVVWHHHGHREGAGLEQLKRDNDYARGAYYAKLILSGGFHNFFNWFRTSWRARKYNKFTHELRGASDYWRWYRNHRSSG